jgi:hypothetical protein
MQLEACKTFLEKLQDYITSEYVNIPTFVKEVGLENNILWFMQKLRGEREFREIEIHKINEYFKKNNTKI